MKPTTLRSTAFFLLVAVLPAVLAAQSAAEAEGAKKPDAKQTFPPSGKDSDAAIAKFSEAIRRNPKDEKAYSAGAKPTRKKASSTRPSLTTTRPSG